MLTHPPNTTIVDTPVLSMGLNEDQILYILYKKTQARTLEETKQAVQEVKKLVGDRKVCMLVDVTHLGETNRSIRTYVAEEMPKMAKAIAILSGSPLGRMMVNLFFSLQPQAFPVKMFSDQTEAVEWLKKHL